MAENTDYLDEYLIRHRKEEWFYFCYIVMGIAIMLFTVNHVPLQTLITLLLSSIGFGGILGYIEYKYQYITCKQEIKYWRCRLKGWVNWDDIFIVFRRKWYTYLFYLLLIMTLLWGLIIQMSIFRHSSKTLLLFVSMAFMNFGSLMFVSLWNGKNIILKLKNLEKESPSRQTCT